MPSSQGTVQKVGLRHAPKGRGLRRFQFVMETRWKSCDVTLHYFYHRLHGLSARGCPMSSHFLTWWVCRLLHGTGFGVLDFRLCCNGVHCRSLRLSIFWCVFSLMHPSSPAIKFHSFFFVVTDVSAPIDRPFTYSHFRCISRLCCGPRGGAGVCMKLKSRFKFLPLPGFEPRTLQSDDCELYH